jgi:hypothetical protein
MLMQTRPMALFHLVDYLNQFDRAAAPDIWNAVYHQIQDWNNTRTEPPAMRQPGGGSIDEFAHKLSNYHSATLSRGDYEAIVASAARADC